MPTDDGVVILLPGRTLRAWFVRGGFPYRLTPEQKWALTLDDFALTLRRCA